MAKTKKKAVRRAFRNAVFKRDRYKCRVCGRQWSSEDEPDAHHITDRTLMPNGGYVAENGITVCDDGPESCHMLCETFHITNGERWVEGLHPNALYRKIGSSHDLALRASEKLG